MNEPYVIESGMERHIVIPDLKYDGALIRLIFSTEPNQKAPALIRELLRKSYINRLASESRRDL